MLKKWRQEVFSSEEVNTERQRELDMGKALMVLCLAWIHCIIECTPEEGLVSGIPYLFDTVIGGPFSAPMYMFAMGIGIAYTRNRTKNYLMIHGLDIEMRGFVLNFCRFMIPLLIGYAITKDRGQFLDSVWYRTFGNDVLLFAGLALMAIGLMIRFGLPKWLMFAIAFACSLLSTAITGIDLNSPVLNTAFGYFIPTEDAAGLVISDFPMITWLIVPVSGYIFGEYLRRVKDKNRFYLLVGTVAAMFAAVHFAVGLKLERGMFGEGQNCYYHMLTDDMLASILCAIGMLAVYHFLGKLLPDWFHAALRNVSRNINQIYCIHWVLVIFITNVILYIINGTQELPVGQVMLLGAGITAVSIALANLWTNRLKKKLFGEKNNEKTA